MTKAKQKAITPAKNNGVQSVVIGSPSPIIGKWFHSFDKIETDKVEWQGQVLGEVHGMYLVQLYEWLMGEPTIQKLVHFEDMKKWNYYDDCKQMQFYWEQRLEKGLR